MQSLVVIENQIFPLAGKDISNVNDKFKWLVFTICSELINTGSSGVIKVNVEHVKLFILVHLL